MVQAKGSNGETVDYTIGNLTKELSSVSGATNYSYNALGYRVSNTITRANPNGQRKQRRLAARRLR
jgi:YD repeat-containing protein